jgi:hypothetical protein
MSTADAFSKVVDDALEEFWWEVEEQRVARRAARLLSG